MRNFIHYSSVLVAFIISSSQAFHRQIRIELETRKDLVIFSNDIEALGGRSDPR